MQENKTKAITIAQRENENKTKAITMAQRENENEDDYTYDLAISMLDLLKLSNDQKKFNEKERQEDLKREVAEYLHKKHIIRQIIAQRPDLQNEKGAELLKNCRNMSMIYIEKLFNIHQNIMQANIVQNWSRSMSMQPVAHFFTQVLPSIWKDLKIQTKHACLNANSSINDYEKQFSKDLNLTEFFKQLLNKKSENHVTKLLQRDITTLENTIKAEINKHARVLTAPINNIENEKKWEIKYKESLDKNSTILVH